MVETTFLFTFNALHWALTVVGVAAAALGVMLAAPLRGMPMLESIARTAQAVERSDLPAVDHFQARDGTTLGYRHYPAHQPAVPRAAVLIHGSSASSIAVHALAKELAAAGVETFAPDIRGHGVSGTRGDIGYLGQLEDDLSDFVNEIRKTRTTMPLTLLGHSSGGGFVLRVAAAPLGTEFERAVMIAPYLGYDAPTSRANSGGWAQADVPRFVALTLLGKLGFHGADALPTLTFAVPPDSKMTLTSDYSYRLMQNFATRDFREEIKMTHRPLALIAAGDDELMLSDQYQAAVGPAVPVLVIPGVNHMAVVSAPDAVAAIAKDVLDYRPAR
jgi:alpha-beta hydrolase superfamily lysophospholipase